MSRDLQEPIISHVLTRAPLSPAMAPQCLKKDLGAKEAPITVIMDHSGTESLT